MKYKLFFVLLGVLFIQCAKERKSDHIELVIIQNEFNEEEVKWFKSEGTATIKGVAKFKTKKGEVLLGEAFRVELMPACAYTKERLGTIYKNDSAGHVYEGDGILTFTPDPEAYHDTRKAMCDKEGVFEFTNLPAGDYYLVAFMLQEEKGGGIMRHVLLSEGESKQVQMLNF